MSLSVIFPAGKDAEAEAYLAHLNANNPDTTPGAIWAILRHDKYGQPVVPYLGPGGHAGGDWPEPDGAEALRADGVLHAMVEWPVEEEG